MKKLLNILLAEDNSNDIELSLAAFKEHNIVNRVDIVKNGVEVMDYLLYREKYKDREKTKPCVILLDIKMPKKDGIEVLTEIRKHPDLKMIPVVMLTSSNLDKDIIESYNLGVNAYIVKPVDFTAFVDAVKNIGIMWAILNKTPF